MAIFHCQYHCNRHLFVMQCFNITGSRKGAAIPHPTVNPCLHSAVSFPGTISWGWNMLRTSSIKRSVEKTTWCIKTLNYLLFWMEISNFCKCSSYSVAFFSHHKNQFSFHVGNLYIIILNNLTENTCHVFLDKDTVCLGKLCPVIILQKNSITDITCFTGQNIQKMLN